ncbi:hypothetical protein D3C71_2082200 [compost metagenome]
MQHAPLWRQRFNRVDILKLVFIACQLGTQHLAQRFTADPLRQQQKTFVITGDIQVGNDIASLIEDQTVHGLLIPDR